MLMLFQIYSSVAVPFIQIFEEQHKEHVRAYIKDGKTIRVFYQNEASRNEAHEMLLDVKDFMLFAAEDAMRVLSDEFSDEAEQELAMRHLMYDDTNLGVTVVDTYANAKPPCFGLDITERLFWESYVMMNDCSRPPRTEWDIGRKSELAFMGEYLTKRDTYADNSLLLWRHYSCYTHSLSPPLESHITMGHYFGTQW